MVAIQGIRRQGSVGAGAGSYGPRETVRDPGVSLGEHLLDLVLLVRKDQRGRVQVYSNHHIQYLTNSSSEEQSGRFCDFRG